LFPFLSGPARAVRAVQCYDGRSYCAIDDRVVAWPVGTAPERPAVEFTGAAATLTALWVGVDGVLAGNSSGSVLRWSPALPDRPETLHRGHGRAVESVWMLSRGGVRRLVYTDTSLCVWSRVVDDSYACRYEASGQTLRRVEAAPDCLVATTDLRDRLIIFDPACPDRPPRITPVSRLTGHSVQDVCLIPVGS